MGEKKNKPFYYLKPNQCRSCGGKLELVDEDIAVAKLDSKGLPIKIPSRLLTVYWANF